MHLYLTRVLFFVFTTFIIIPSAHFIHCTCVPPLFDCTVPWYLIFYYNEQSWNDSQLNSGRTANIRALHKIVRMKTVSDSLSNPICTFVVHGSGCEHWVIYYHYSNTIAKQKEADPTPPSLQIIIICFYTTWCHTLQRFCYSSITSVKHVVYVAWKESLPVCYKKVQFLVNELNFDRIFTKWVHSLQL